MVDVSVSFDGTWAKRGHTSMFGVVFAISIDSGEVLDYEVLSKFCKVCSNFETKKGDEDYFRKFNEHKNSGQCKINYEGSSNAMEVTGAIRLWRRSNISLNRAHAMNFVVGRGGSKGVLRVLEHPSISTK